MISLQSLVVVGLQWGDEGKGKIVDVLSENFDIVVRFQGGSNAGHTVIVGDQTHKFRIIPAGAVRGKKVVIGNGVVVDPPVLLKEIDELKRAGINVDLLVSDRAHLITPYQIQIDGLQEASKVDKKVGTTKRGIGPTYADKVSRVGVRFCDFVDNMNEQWSLLESTSKSCIEKVHGSMVEDPASSSYDAFSLLVRDLLPYVGDCGEYLESAIASGQRILFEGAQGALLDIDHGTYPYVTSSNCVSAAAATGTGVSSSRLNAVLGVCKSYLTRVGTGPFPTELDDEIGAVMRDRGHEYGTVTGRPRRCGWLDLVALKYAIRLNGCNFLALTKADVLTGINPLKICVGYHINGVEVTSFPASVQVLSEAIPIYEELEGWSQEVKGSTGPDSFEDLPDALVKYLNLIETYTKSKIALISFGPERTDTIVSPEIQL
jgi:adenylosuccinate synthase